MEKERLNHELFRCSETAQIIQVAIDPGHTITAGIIFSKWFDDGIRFEKEANRTGSLNKSGFGKLLDSGIKKFGRAADQVIYFTNSTRASKSIAFAAPSKRRIIPIQVFDQDQKFFCHKDAFVCAESGLELVFESGRKSKSNIKGLGKSDWLEFRGNGTLFVHVGGKLKKTLLKKQAIKIDQRCIVGFTSGIGYDRADANLTRLNRSDLKAYFRTKLSGCGTVYMQSKPFKMPKHARSLTQDIGELVNKEALRLYKGNLKKIKNIQWSALQDRVKSDIVKNTLKIKKALPAKIKNLAAKKG